MTEPMVETPIAEEPLERPKPAPENVWIPEGRSAREELRRPRYLIMLVIAVTVIALQIWLLF